MYAHITLDLYTPSGMWCEYCVHVYRCHVHVCVHHPGSLHTIWNVVWVLCACVYVSCACMCASPWISTHRLECGVSTVCMCIGVMCMYVCITLDLYTPFGMWCEYCVHVYRCHVHVCTHHPGSLHTIWNVVWVLCACVYVSCACMCITLDLYTPFGVWCGYCVRVCMCHVHVCVHHPGSLHTIWGVVWVLCACVYVSCARMRASPCLGCVYFSVHVCMSDRYVYVYFEYWDLQLHICMCKYLTSECAGGHVRACVCVCDRKTTFYCICSYN